MSKLLISSLTAMALTAALAGCASEPTHYVHSHAAVSSSDQARAMCAYQADASTATYHTEPRRRGESAALGAAIADGVIVAGKRAELTDECMRAQGYVATR